MFLLLYLDCMDAIKLFLYYLHGCNLISLDFLFNYTIMILHDNELFIQQISQIMPLALTQKPYLVTKYIILFHKLTLIYTNK